MWELRRHVSGFVINSANLVAWCSLIYHPLHSILYFVHWDSPLLFTFLSLKLIPKPPYPPLSTNLSVATFHYCVCFCWLPGKLLCIIYSLGCNTCCITNTCCIICAKVLSSLEKLRTNTSSVSAVSVMPVPTGHPGWFKHWLRAS